jgi:hypothetical protein
MENAQTLGTVLTAHKLRGNSVIFKHCRMINSEKSILQNKTVITMCAVILLLLCRLHRHATTFCAFEKVRETTLAEKGHREQ